VRVLLVADAGATAAAAGASDETGREGEAAPGSGGLAAALRSAGCSVRACADGLAGLHAFIRALPDLIVASDRQAGLDGFELARRVRELSDVPIALLVAGDSASIRERALRLGVDRILVRGADAGELAASVIELVTGVRGSGAVRLTAAHVRRAVRSELRAELERLLVECRGNLAEMARRMGRDRSTVRYHLRRFGMLVEDPVVWTNRRPRDAEVIEAPAAR